jgi:transketolase
MIEIHDPTATTAEGAGHRPPGLGYHRLRDLIELQVGDEKHLASATSTLDVLWVLYDRVLRVRPETVDDPDRDRFLLSKGHGPMAYYAVLAAKGFFPVSWLPTFGRFDSPLGMHPDRALIPGVEIASGSLGHGLPLGVGLALGLRAQGRHRPRVIVLVGDAELDEGSNFEAIAFAARARLDRLTVVVIDNRSSTHGWPGGIDARFRVEGWATRSVDGRDHAQLGDAFRDEAPDRPMAVVAVTGAGR